MKIEWNSTLAPLKIQLASATKAICNYGYSKARNTEILLFAKYTGNGVPLPTLPRASDQGPVPKPEPLIEEELLKSPH
jgi:hypothetical protein